jgi:hypothetical protein
MGRTGEGKRCGEWLGHCAKKDLQHNNKTLNLNFNPNPTSTNSHVISVPFTSVVISQTTITHV